MSQMPVNREISLNELYIAMQMMDFLSLKGGRTMYEEKYGNI